MQDYRASAARIVQSFTEPVRRFFGMEEAARFQQVKAAELAEVNAARSLRGRTAVNDDLAGLALSGGGIRSATFNLGILQGLAENGFLRQMDYLSTISGGGYIGAWLVGWIRRAGSQRVEDRLREDQQTPPRHEASRYLEPDQIRFLRRYSNYLTPRAGLLSTDTWAALAVYLRNLILNLVLLVSFGACVLLLPDFALRAVQTRTLPPDCWLEAILVAALVVALAVVGIGFGGLSSRSPARVDWRQHIVRHAGAWTATPLFLAALSATLLLNFGKLSLSKQGWKWAGFSAVAYLVLWGVSSAARWWSQEGLEPQPAEQEPLFRITFPPFLVTLLAGALQGFTSYWVWRIFQLLDSAPKGGVNAGSVAIVAFGPALVVATLLLTAVFHIGLAGRNVADAEREWVARAAAVLSLTTWAWVILCSATFYGPLLINLLTVSHWAQMKWGQLFKWILAGGWLSATVGGALAGRSAATNGKGNGRLQLLTRLAPPVFVLGLVLLLSSGVSTLLSGLPKGAGGTAAELAARHWEELGSYRLECLLWVLGAGLVLIGILGNRVDVNEFSMHLFYRNRLTRAFLGASQFARQPDPFTGFSVEDDIKLQNLTTTSPQPREPLDSQTPPTSSVPEPYDGPYPILSTALNLVRGKELAWQTRKVTSFVYTPLYCGYDYFANQPDWRGDFFSAAYRPTAWFGGRGGPTLGTAVAVSGAAASPNMGYHTSSALAFLMAVFNVRLGWWAGNPRHRRTWRRHGPVFGLLYLLRELFPSTSDQMGYVYLSDGGHFENLGIYELVRRRCRYIIASDASQDGNASFEDLGNAIEKCRRDFGVEIVIEVKNLRRDDKTRLSGAHFALGTLLYPDGFCGYLLYIKSSLTGDEPRDVQAYGARDQAFPHDSTANQFFDEPQFESYRALGQHIFREVMESASRPVPGLPLPPPTSLATLFANLESIATAHAAGSGWVDVNNPLDDNLRLSIRQP